VRDQTRISNVSVRETFWNWNGSAGWNFELKLKNLVLILLEVMMLGGMEFYIEYRASQLVTHILM
jgi:hypothetical protein